MQLKDLAKAANVSVSTVSKALKGSKELHDDTINHVLKVAEDCGYFVSKKKQRKINVKKGGRVMIVVPEVVSVHYSSLATELVDKIRAKGFEAQICLYNFEDERRNAIFNASLRDEGVVGIVALDCGYEGKENDTDFPVISVGAKCSVSIDVADGIKQAIKYLKDLGHGRIYFIGENLTKSREMIFLDALKESAFNVDDCARCKNEYRFERAGYSAAEELIERGDLPTAIICAYDEIAFGAISALMRHGYKVPEDVSVIGINDVPSAKYFPVPLTTIGISKRECCDELVRRLENAMMGESESLKFEMKTSLIIRDSTTKAKV